MMLIRNICENYKVWQLPLVVLSGSFAISTSDRFCVFCACVFIMMHICVYVFSFYHLYIIYNPFYVSTFLNCHGKILLFYVLTCVALLNIVIDTSAL